MAAGTDESTRALGLAGPGERTDGRADRPTVLQRPADRRSARGRLTCGSARSQEGSCDSNFLQVWQVDPQSCGTRTETLGRRSDPEDRLRRLPHKRWAQSTLQIGWALPRGSPGPAPRWSYSRFGPRGHFRLSGTRSAGSDCPWTGLVVEAP